MNAIYGDGWATVDAEGQYCIPITVGWKLLVVFPENYPSADPPVFQIAKCNGGGGGGGLHSKSIEDLARELQEMFQVV